MESSYCARGFIGKVAFLFLSGKGWGIRVNLRELCRKMLDGDGEEDKVITLDGEVITHMELCTVIGCNVMQSIAEENLILDEKTKAGIRQMMIEDYGINLEFELTWEEKT